MKSSVIQLLFPVNFFLVQPAIVGTFIKSDSYVSQLSWSSVPTSLILLFWFFVNAVNFAWNLDKAQSENLVWYSHRNVHCNKKEFQLAILYVFFSLLVAHFLFEFIYIRSCEGRAVALSLSIGYTCLVLLNYVFCNLYSQNHLFHCRNTVVFSLLLSRLENDYDHRRHGE